MNSRVMAFCLLAIFAGVLQAEDHISLKQELSDSYVGWTVATDKNYRDQWMNNLLILQASDGKKRRFVSSRPFIEKWGLTDNNMTVVIRSRGAHGASLVEAFEIATGTLLREAPGSLHLADTAEWAKPWCDESEK